MIVHAVMIALSVFVLCCASNGALSSDLTNAMLRKLPESHVTLARQADVLPRITKPEGLADALALVHGHDEFHKISVAVSDATDRLAALSELKVMP